MNRRYIPVTDNPDLLQAAAIALALIVKDSHHADGQPLMRYSDKLYKSARAIIDDMEAESPKHRGNSHAVGSLSDNAGEERTQDP